MIKYGWYEVRSGESDSGPLGEKREERKIIPEAVVGLVVDNELIEAATIGNSKIDALFKAFCAAANSNAIISLISYQINVRSVGKPQSRANVRLTVNQERVEEAGWDDDPDKAFLLALISAVNKVQKQDEKEPQPALNYVSERNGK